MTVKTEKRMLVTILAEALIESRLIEALQGLGVRGYSVSSCRGDSIGTVRASEWEGDNVEIKTLVSKEMSEQILTTLRERFIENFAVVVYRTEVDILRSDKF
jgi:hypothetical protein